MVFKHCDAPPRKSTNRYPSVHSALSAFAHLPLPTSTMAPKVKIYGIPPSAPCRVVYLTCHVLGLDYEVVPMDPRKGQTKEPEFLKLNPHHNIPLLVDGDYTLNESRPCALYLAEKYGKDSKLLPEDAEARGRVFHDLFFDMGSYYKAVLDCTVCKKAFYAHAF